MRRTLQFSAVLLLLWASPGAAQAWDAPSFFSPRQHDDLGLYAFAPEHGDWGLMGIWRQSGNLSLGVRAGFANDIVLVGVEFYGPLHLSGSPLLLAWQLGVGAGFNDVTVLRVPFGVSIGGNLGSGGSVQIMPYVFPRVALSVVSRDANGEEHTDTDLDLDVDLGADLMLTPAWVLRVGATLGDNEAFGIGMAHRMQRRVVVR